MKVFYRILYSLAVVLMFLAMDKLIDRSITKQYFETEGKEQFVDGNPDKYRFFYGTTGYHKKEATYTIIENGYKIQFFQIDRVFTKKNSPTLVKEYFYIIIDHPTKVLINEFPQRNYLRVTNSNGDVKSFKIHQFKQLNFSVVVDQNESGLIPAEYFFDKEYNKIEIFEFEEGKDDHIILSQPIEFEKKDLDMKDYLVDYHDNEEKLNENNIYFPLLIVGDKYAFKYYSIMFGYFIIIFLATYFLFIRRNNRTKKKQRHN